MYKRIFFSLILVCSCYFSNGQSASDTSFTLSVINFEWMPDGDNIVLHVMKLPNGSNSKMVSKSFLCNVRQKTLHLLLDDARSPAPSPDGKVIAYARKLPSGKLDIFLYNLEKKENTVLSEDTTSKFAPEWSPDGRQLVYNIVKDGIIDVCVIDLKSGHIQQITHGDKSSSNYSPSWSPDGQRIVYFLDRGNGRDQLFLTDPKGSSQTNLTKDSSTHNIYPSWFGGNKIMYTLFHEKVAIIKADGTDRVIIEGIDGFFARSNVQQNKIAYLTRPPASMLMLYDMKNKKNELLVDPSKLKEQF